MSRREQFIAEIGLGPVWRLRDTGEPAGRIEEQPATPAKAKARAKKGAKR